MNLNARLEKIESILTRRTNAPPPPPPGVKMELDYVQVAEDVEMVLFGRVVTPHDELVEMVNRPAPEGPQPPIDYDKLGADIAELQHRYRNTDLTADPSAEGPSL